MFDSKAKKSQLELGVTRVEEPDRNFELGGRSFYFFDLDDNVFYLTTPIYIFEKETKKELALTSGDFAKYFSQIGSRGQFKNYFIDYDDNTGTFRRFRDIVGPQDAQPFVEDLLSALYRPDFDWKGPSWSCFYHASFNQRPMSLITARGHDPETIKHGIKIFVKEGFLPKEPNYLSVYPVSHPTTMEALSSGRRLSTSELKWHAVIESVEKAMQVYGYNPHHRFGMSDDDPKNLELILDAMQTLKRKYPENSFFVIHTKDASFVKEEVFVNHIEQKSFSNVQQLNLLLDQK